jgi:uncharacterized protein with FMN-binding domain
MRVRALTYSLVGCAAAIALSWELGHAAAPPAPPLAAPASSAPPAPAPASPGTSSSAKPSRSTSGSSGTFAGATAQTDYGPVQVAIVVQGGRITDVKALQLTNQGGRSVAISAAAAPVLRSEALKAQSARIATVSGASYTSDGYRRSLQSAIDKAHL